MRTIELAAEVAEDVLVTLARHVGPTVAIGRPVLAMPDDEDGTVMVLVAVGPEASAVWWVSATEASRVLPLGAGRAELTCWRDGREVSRTFGAG